MMEPLVLTPEEYADAMAFCVKCNNTTVHIFSPSGNRRACMVCYAESEKSGSDKTTKEVIE